MKKVGILLPAYNEEKNIGKILRNAKSHFPRAIIVVVDDGSKDKTAKIAAKEGAVVIKHQKNLGKGEALKTGFEFFRKIKDVEYVIVADSDGQYLIEDGKKLLEVLKAGKADFVMGRREWKDVPFPHRLGNFVWRNAFNLMFGTHLKDTNCGFVGLNRKALERIENTGGGYIIENSLLIEALKKGLRIEQVPVRVVYKNVSKLLRGIRMVLGILIFIIKEGLKYRLSLLAER